MRASKNRKPYKEEAVRKITPDPLGLTGSVLNRNVHIELNGNTEALIEGCNGIIEYNENVIRLSTGKFIVKFSGRKLQVSCMTDESIVVGGHIVSVEYLY